MYRHEKKAGKAGYEELPGEGSGASNSFSDYQLIVSPSIVFFLVGVGQLLEYLKAQGGTFYVNCSGTIIDSTKTAELIEPVPFSSGLYDPFYAQVQWMHWTEWNMAFAMIGGMLEVFKRLCPNNNPSGCLERSGQLILFLNVMLGFDTCGLLLAMGLQKFDVTAEEVRLFGVEDTLCKKPPSDFAWSLSSLQLAVTAFAHFGPLALAVFGLRIFKKPVFKELSFPMAALMSILKTIWLACYFTFKAMSWCGNLKVEGGFSLYSGSHCMFDDAGGKLTISHDHDFNHSKNWPIIILSLLFAVMPMVVQRLYLLCGGASKTNGRTPEATTSGAKTDFVGKASVWTKYGTSDHSQAGSSSALHDPIV